VSIAKADFVNSGYLRYIAKKHEFIIYRGGSIYCRYNRHSGASIADAIYTGG